MWELDEDMNWIVSLFVSVRCRHRTENYLRHLSTTSEFPGGAGDMIYFRNHYAGISGFSHCARKIRSLSNNAMNLRNVSDFTESIMAFPNSL